MKATTKERQLENKNRFLALKESFLDAFEVSGAPIVLQNGLRKTPINFIPSWYGYF